MIWLFIKKVVSKFVFILSGSILALYYIFVSPYLDNFDYKYIFEIGVPAVGFFLACFLAWRDIHLENIELERKIAQLEDSLPKYKLVCSDGSKTLTNLLEEIDQKVINAKLELSKAPQPHAWMPALTNMYGPPSAGAWASYIKELGEYKLLVKSIIIEQKYKIINIKLINSGKSDSNINVSVTFHGAEQVVEFYSNHIELEQPHEPSSIMAISPHIGLADKLGTRREIHEEQKDLLSVEFSNMRGGDSFDLTYDPIFLLVSHDEEPVAKYTIKSDKVIKTDEKILKIK